MKYFALAPQCANELNNIYDVATTRSELKNEIQKFNLKYRTMSVVENELILMDGSIMLLDESTGRWEVKMCDIKPDEEWKKNLLTITKSENPNAIIIAAPSSMGKTQQAILANKVKALKSN